MAKKTVSKDNKKKSTKAKKTTKERRIEKELMWIVGFMIFLVLVFLAASAIFKSFNRINYQGLVFNKERLGEIPVYHYDYYFEDRGELFKYNLYLRNDPRMLDVPVEGRDILFDRGKRLYVSVNSSGLQECSQSVLAVGDLARFLTDNQFDVKGGDPGFFSSAANKQEWVTCENKPKNIVVLIREGEESKISINDKCHEITVGNCEILEAVEKYKVQSIIDAKQNP